MENRTLLTSEYENGCGTFCWKCGFVYILYYRYKYILFSPYFNEINILCRSKVYTIPDEYLTDLRPK